MNLSLIILVLVLSLSTILSVYIAAYVNERKKLSGTREFILLCICNVFYSIGYTLELLCVDLSIRFWAIKIQYIGLSFMATILVLFALNQLLDRSVKFSALAALFIVPIITFLCVWTAEFHEFYYKNPRILSEGPINIFIFERGFYYYINAIYQTCLMAAGSVLLTVHAFKSKGKKKIQAFILAAGSLLPLANGLLYLFDFIPEGFDSGPLVLSVVFLIYAFVLFRLGLFKLLPAARALAIDAISDGLIVLDTSGRLQDLNRPARDYPYMDGVVEGDLLSPLSPISECIKNMTENGECSAETSIKNIHGEQRHFAVKSYPVLAGNGSLHGTAILISDITEKVLLIEELDRLARTDELTGQFNRRSILEMGRAEIARSCRLGHPVGVLLLDLDFFKSVNDRFGHEAGDRVLKTICKILHKELRTIDTLGRYGGEEFLVLLPGADSSAGLAIAERCRKAVETEVIPNGGTDIRITVSIGVHTQVVDETTDITRLITFADEALYEAKENGRNRSCLYNHSLNA